MLGVVVPRPEHERVLHLVGHSLWGDEQVRQSGVRGVYLIPIHPCLLKYAPLHHKQLLRTTICRTAIDQERPHMNKPGKHTSIPAVAWWQIGNEVSLCLYIHQPAILLSLPTNSSNIEFQQGGYHSEF